jgi:hypothetical protein
LSINKIIIVFIILISLPVLAQSARIGVILDINNQPVENVNVTTGGSRTQSMKTDFILSG